MRRDISLKSIKKNRRLPDILLEILEHAKRQYEAISLLIGPFRINYLILAICVVLKLKVSLVYTQLKKCGLVAVVIFPKHHQNKIDGIIGGSEHFVKELPIQEVIDYANQKLKCS